MSSSVISPSLSYSIVEFCDLLSSRTYKLYINSTLNTSQLLIIISRLFYKNIIGFITAEYIIIPPSIIISNYKLFNDTSMYIIAKNENTKELIKLKQIQMNKLSLKNNYQENYEDLEDQESNYFNENNEEEDYEEENNDDYFEINVKFFLVLF